MWKLNGNFHGGELGGTPIRKFTNTDGSPVYWTDTSPTDRIYYCDRALTMDGGLVFNFAQCQFHVYLEESEDEKKG